MCSIDTIVIGAAKGALYGLRSHPDTVSSGNYPGSLWGRWRAGEGPHSGSQIVQVLGHHDHLRLRDLAGDAFVGQVIGQLVQPGQQRGHIRLLGWVTDRGHGRAGLGHCTRSQPDASGK